MHFGENSVDGKPEGEVEDHADDGSRDGAERRSRPCCLAGFQCRAPTRIQRKHRAKTLPRSPPGPDRAGHERTE